MKKLLQAKANHLRYAYRDRDFGSKKRYGFGLKPHFWPENALLITILERFRKYKAQNNQGAMYAFHRHHN
jgi:hypothetical protein